MAESNFVDYVKIYCRSGKGGRGSAHFRREKYIPKGGPDGGDGGNGGSIYIRANRNYWTLLHLRFNRHIYAPSGESGAGALKTGSSGSDVIIEVPLGTSVYDATTGEFILDVTRHEEQKLLLKGGRGGKGNSITAAKPKIADYPFTTLVPNLGIVSYRDNRSFVMADIPGIIEGAAEGKGLGLRFLRHIERNSILLFMIPIDTEHIYREYEVLLAELLKYNPGLGSKRRLLAITKCDLADDELIEMVREEIPQELPHVFISAVAQRGLTELKDLLWQELNREMPYDNTELVREAMQVETLHDDDALYNKEGAIEWLEDDEDDEDELLDIEWDDEVKDELGLND